MNPHTNSLDPRPTLKVNHIRSERVLGAVLWLSLLVVILRFASLA